MLDMLLSMVGAAFCPVSVRTLTAAAGRAGTSRAQPMDQAIIDCFAYWTTGRPALSRPMQVTGRDLAADLSTRIVRKQTGVISHRTRRGRK